LPFSITPSTRNPGTAWPSTDLLSLLGALPSRRTLATATRRDTPSRSSGRDTAGSSMSRFESQFSKRSGAAAQFNSSFREGSGSAG
jgi:hypothetical protein